MARKQGTPIWVTCGCGCVLLVILVIGALAAASYFGASMFQGYLKDMKDPASRAVRAGEILGTSRLPDGYSAQLFLRIPWILDLAVLTDGEPAVIEDEHDLELDADSLGEHLFVFFELRKQRMSEKQVERMLRGDSASDGIQVDVGFAFDSDQELSQGEFEIESQRLRYTSHRGEVELDGGDVPGIYSQLIIECPDDRRTRVAVWFQRASGAVDGSADLSGSPADEAALARFMAHFNVCVA